MLGQLLTKFIGTQSEREIKRLRPRVAEISALDPQIQTLTDEQLRARTGEFRQRFAAGESVDDLLPEAFAVVREAGKRVLNMRHFDVQLIGGMVLHSGKIAEMRTGEGKTLVATLPAYLNALEGKGVHVVTVNDYLARRDADWMGQIYSYLGLTVGVVNSLNVSYLYDSTEKDKDKEHDEVSGYKVMYEFLKPCSRREAYGADITYGTNNEYGFDYLRDNLAQTKEGMIQRGHNYAVVDEIDSILIDESRTPLIIAGEAGDSES